jgi:type I restriction enzyme S subunit
MNVTLKPARKSLLKYEKFESQPIPFPPLAEQHRIVAKVDELMALCDKLEAAQAKREKRRDRLVAATLHSLNNGNTSPASGTRPTFKDSARFYLNHLPRLTTRPEHIHQLRQTILNLAVRGKLVPQEFEDEPASALLERVAEWRAEAIRNRLIRSPRKPLKTICTGEMPYALPEGWAWARLGEVVYIQSGDGLTAAGMKEGAIPVYGGNGVTGYHNAFNVEEPTVVIGRVGYHCGSVHVTPKRAWVTDNAFITRFCSHEIFLKFLVLLLKGTNLKENENATAQPVISGSKIYPIVVGIPPLSEQHRMVAKMEALMAQCDNLENRLAITATTHKEFLGAALQEALAL